MPEYRHAASGRWLAPLLIVAGTLTTAGARAQAVATAVTPPISAAALAEIDDHIAHYYTAMKIVSTIHDPAGRAVDCVDIQTQPALRNPLLAGHQTQLEPSDQLKRILPGPVTTQSTDSLCPVGSIPVRTPTRKEIISAGSLRNFQSKYRQTSDATPTGRVPPAVYSHEYANVGAYVDNIAAQSTFNLWKPATANGAEFSLTQLWIVGGSGSGLQTIEIGSQVYPNKYGDTNPHLFLYFTADNYASTGCYNLDCGAFVQTNSGVTIGGTLGSSTPGGAQVEGTVAFYRDPATGNWILFTVSSGVYTQIGYYPGALFGSGQLTQYAQRIDFGGEVYVVPGSSHSGTDMGSGAFATAGYQQAAYQRNLLYMNRSNVIRDFSPAWINETNANCYSLWQGWSASWGNHIYFGGPGRNANCP